MECVGEMLINQKQVDEFYSKPVGLLHDSYYNNTGDKAIGLVAEEFLKKNKIHYEIMNPKNFDANKYRTVIVGGGLLIRDKGTDYYEAFRLRGGNILNAMDIMTTQELDYLKDYHYLSVRSHYVQNSLKKLGIKASYVPDTAINMNKTNKAIKLPKGSVGFHFSPNLDLDINKIIELVKKISLTYPVVLIPFTHYANDPVVLKQIKLAVPNNVIILDEHSPQTLFDTIANLKFLVTTSLHAAIFAYTNNVNFLLWNNSIDKKRLHFAKDRGLTGHLFKNVDEAARKLPKYLNQKYSFQQLINDDRKLLSEHFKQIRQILLPESETARMYYATYNIAQNRINANLEILEKYNRDLKKSKTELELQLNKLSIENSVLHNKLGLFDKSRAWKMIRKFDKFR